VYIVLCVIIVYVYLSLVVFVVFFLFCSISFSTLILLAGSFLTCKNRIPYNLYCVGGDVKHCSLTDSDQSCVTRENSIVFMILADVAVSCCHLWSLHFTYLFYLPRWYHQLSDVFVFTASS